MSRLFGFCSTVQNKFLLYHHQVISDVFSSEVLLPFIKSAFMNSFWDRTEILRYFEVLGIFTCALLDSNLRRLKTVVFGRYLCLSLLIDCNISMWRNITFHKNKMVTNWYVLVLGISTYVLNAISCYRAYSFVSERMTY